MLAGNALGVKLDPVDRQGFVLKAHDGSAIPASFAAVQNATAPCKFGSVTATALAPCSAASRTMSSGRSSESMKL